MEPFSYNGLDNISTNKPTTDTYDWLDSKKKNAEFWILINWMLFYLSKENK